MLENLHNKMPRLDEGEIEIAFYRNVAPALPIENGNEFSLYRPECSDLRGGTEPAQADENNLSILDFVRIRYLYKLLDEMYFQSPLFQPPLFQSPLRGAQETAGSPSFSVCSSLQNKRKDVHEPGKVTRYIVWSEVELPMTNSYPCEELRALFVQVLQRSGRASSPAEGLGIIPMMASWLSDLGYHVCYDTARIIDISAGTKLHEPFLLCIYDLAVEARPFVLQSGVTTPERYDRLLNAAITDIQTRTFCGVLYARCVVAFRRSGL
ncbi:hypothetical protein EPA93_22460 [Ktedonosporobacter rubrisoli]|uniref:Uncharacterized protein n=1 Tax=Ktedonosporobacter rubrisoli TaxID=2509675 RepID=A0A4P6JTF8_KTERU|nr:hypothetical protein [Ktedonosporobacter rubrisoli]QBD78605.1 hypothetical protein EPA93_22460 [Ktedonosporobacter rubrisoli]